MTIETKFSMGDIVYYMDENVVKKHSITRIETSRGNTQIQNYDKYISEGNFTKFETQIFETKQELLDSL